MFFFVRGLCVLQLSPWSTTSLCVNSRRHGLAKQESILDCSNEVFTWTIQEWRVECSPDQVIIEPPATMSDTS